MAPGGHAGRCVRRRVWSQAAATCRTCMRPVTHAPKSSPDAKRAPHASASPATDTAAGFAPPAPSLPSCPYRLDPNPTTDIAAWASVRTRSVWSAPVSSSDTTRSPSSGHVHVRHTGTAIGTEIAIPAAALESCPK
eukprot:191984-Rhodomonas_salina.1